MVSIGKPDRTVFSLQIAGKSSVPNLNLLEKAEETKHSEIVNLMT